MSETFSEITGLSHRLHQLWSKAGQRKATDEDRSEMKRLQWRTLPGLWHGHRCELARAAALENFERLTVSTDILDDYLARARVGESNRQVLTEGFHIEVVQEGRKTFTEEALDSQRRSSPVHYLPLRELHQQRRQQLRFTVGAQSGRAYSTLV